MSDGALKTVIARFEPYQGEASSGLKSWSSWFSGSPPQAYKSEKEYPCCHLVNYQELSRGRWMISIQSVHFKAKSDIDFTFQVSCNLVQHEEWTETKKPIIVPQPLELFTVNVSATKRGEARFSTNFFVINNSSDKIMVYIDQIGVVSSNLKRFDQLFSSMHVFVLLKKVG